MRDFENAPKTIDYFFQYFPEYDTFHLFDIIKKSDLSTSDKYIVHENDAIEIMLVDRLKYAVYVGNTKLIFKLTDLGRQVKNIGGHFAYLKSLENEKQQDLQRKNLTDKKLIIDIFNAEFESNQGQKIKRRTFRLAILTFLFGIVGSALVQKLLFSDSKNQQHYIPSANQQTLDTLKNEIKSNKIQIEQLQKLLSKDTLKK